MKKEFGGNFAGLTVAKAPVYIQMNVISFAK